MEITVVTASKSLGIGEGLTYESGDAAIRAGSAVRVPLRKTLVEGIVVSVLEKRSEKRAFALKHVAAVLGEAPLLPEPQIETARWIAAKYVCSLRQALGAFLPAPPWSKLLPPERQLIRASPDLDPTPRGTAQAAALRFLRGKGWVPKEELVRKTGATTAVLRAMRTKGWIDERAEREPVSVLPPPEVARPALTEPQRAALGAIKSATTPALLFGVTGSGKTEIYMELVADCVEAGKQAILLVPEILLTEHVIDRCRALLPADRIAVIHSKLTPAQRRSEWRRARSGEVALVVGSRSALFSPLPRLGLVVIDEEHEWTYKNEQTPRYHARETAEALCRAAGARLVLGTATPSLEAWSRATSGEYALARLPARFGGRPMPSTRIIDLGEAKFGEHYPFTAPLIDAVRERLERREQCVLFLNRKGSATSLLCLQCRRRMVSATSGMPYTVHRSGGAPYLLDHVTGNRAAVPATCPGCGSAGLLEVGAGTERIETLVKTLFPTAKALRADGDTMDKPERIRELLRSMRDRKADILLGTQSVVKGLDLPEVTLAAVLVADVGLSLPHFRAGERVAQMLTQLTGRSGRASPGDVIIQTFRPGAPEVVAAAEHAFEKYLDAELELRAATKYPPAAAMIRLLLRGPDAARRAKHLHADALSAALDLGNDAKITVAPTLFGGGWEWHVLLRGSNPAAIMPKLKLAGVSVDVDPVETA